MSGENFTVTSVSGQVYLHSNSKIDADLDQNNTSQNSALVSLHQSTSNDFTNSQAILAPGSQIQANTSIEIGPNSALIAHSASGQVIEINAPGIYQYQALVNASPNSPQGDTNNQSSEAALTTPDNFDPNTLEPTAAGSTEGNTENSTVEAGSTLASSQALSELINSDDQALFGAEDSIELAPEFSIPSLQDSEENGTQQDTTLIAFNELEVSTSEPTSIDLLPVHLSEDSNQIGQGASGNDESFATQNISTQYGNFSLSEDGNWRYELNHAMAEVQALGAGDSLEEEISYESLSGTRYTLQVNINGSNDSAQITGDKRATLGEDQNDQASGQLLISDADADEAMFNAVDDQQSAYGSVSVDSSGAWQYQLNNDASAIQSLRSGDTIYDTFAVTSADGSNQLIRITINGSDDKPIIGGNNNANLNLESSAVVGGKLDVQDADFGESKFDSADKIDGQFGYGSIDANGNWSYHVDTSNPLVQGLAEGSRQFDTFDVRTVDGTSQTVIVSIIGTDGPIADGPAISVASTSQDLYLWTPEQSPLESISGFELGPSGDKLVISDLLVEASSEQELEQFMHFSVNEQGNTVLEIAANTESSSASHSLTLENLDVSGLGHSDGEIIHNLIESGNLELIGLA